jgi:hypothetical protein
MVSGVRGCATNTRSNGLCGLHRDGELLDNDLVDLETSAIIRAALSQ